MYVLNILRELDNSRKSDEMKETGWEQIREAEFGHVPVILNTRTVRMTLHNK